MKHWGITIIYSGIFLLAFLAGCEQPQPLPEPAREPLDPTKTIGSIARIHYFEAIPVRGIGIVAGLPGTGSSECPPVVREKLEKFIWKQIPTANGIDTRAFIESPNTAVVEVFGVIPALASATNIFDVAVRPLAGSQSTSLDGGHLYTTELKELSRLANLEQFAMFSRTMATAEGPVYSNKLSERGENSDRWYVLGGGQPEQGAKIRLIINEPDFLTANVIRNRINERFKAQTAVPLSEAEIILNIPVHYRDRKERFLAMIQSLQLGANPELKQIRAEQLIQQLLENSDDETHEIALEAVGRPALDSLMPLLEHPNEAVRFHAARCVLNIGDNRAIKPLREILLTPASPFRLEAIKAIGRNATRIDARAILSVALSDTDMQVRLAAYENLLQMNSPSISRKIVAGDFVIDSVVCPGPKIIYVYQQKTPRIVLFGSPIYCNQNIFVQSEDGSVTINARAGAQYASVSRRHPQRPRVIGPLRSGFEVSTLIQTLGERAEVNSRAAVLPGLSIAYAEILPLLEKMCDNNAVPAAFIAGPPAAVDPMLQNLPPISR